jgi:long-chain acyl-CoA synthetase
MFIALGGSIGYWQGNVNYLVDDIGALKPSIFIGVPRVFDRIYNRVTDQVCVVLASIVGCCGVLLHCMSV